MHEDLFAQATVGTRLSAPAIVCHLALRPFSLGHELFLIHRRNAIILNTVGTVSTPSQTSPEKKWDAVERVPTLEEKIAAVLEAADICSQSWAELNFAPRTRWQRWRMKRVYSRWHRAVMKSAGRDAFHPRPKKVWDGVESVPLEYFETEIAKFRDYYELGKLDFPGKIPDDAEGEVRYIGAPEVLRLYQFLGEHVPAGEIAQHGSSAWDFPYGLARMHYSAHQEREGSWTIYNWADEQHDKYVREREAESGAEKRGITIVPPVGTDSTPSQTEKVSDAVGACARPQVVPAGLEVPCLG